MALYRNIAGVNPRGIGVTLSRGDFGTPAIPYVPPPTQTADLAAASQAETIARYDYLLSTALLDLIAAGYYVTTDNGSIFKANTDGTASAYLPIQDIQWVENQRGTAGTLLMHFNEPVIAKDTAGHASGGSTSGGSVDVYSTPIDEVLLIPDQPSGSNVIQDYKPVTTGLALMSDDTSTGTTQTASQTTSVTKAGNMLPLLTVAGLTIVAISGVKLLKKKTGVVFAGGLGILYYSMRNR